VCEGRHEGQSLRFGAGVTEYVDDSHLHPALPRDTPGAHQPERVAKLFSNAVHGAGVPLPAGFARVT